MIKGVNTGVSGGYLNINSNGYTPYVSPNANNPLTGVIRINGSNTEVFDGSTWISFGSYADVNLSSTAIEALDWCQRQMIADRKLHELAGKNVTVADALIKYEEAREQLNVVLALTKED